MSVDTLIASLSLVHPKGYDLSLDRVRRLLSALGDPQDRLPPVIHVAGTNGKGSTIAFCRAVLEAGGRAVHVHTSPHLVDWRERFRLGRTDGPGRFVEDARLEEVLARVAAVNAGETITVFELLTAAMFVLFSEHPADVALIEVGLGGRLDATNVIERPAACIITAISLDHQEHLGDTVERIALEKAGIIKPGVPVIVAPQSAGVRDALEEAAARKGAPAVLAGQDFDVYEQGGRLIVQDEHGLLDLPLPRLRGPHQLANAATAVAALRAAARHWPGASRRQDHSPARSPFDLPDAAFEAGMESVTWPGRLERLRSGTLTALAPPEAEVWIDGGHNPGAGEALALALSVMEERAPMPLVLVCAMLTTKQPAGYFAAFRDLVKEVVTVPVPGSEASFAPEDLARLAREAGLEATAAPSLTAALAQLRESHGERSVRILISGSLYLVGAALRANGTPPV